MLFRISAIALVTSLVNAQTAPAAGTIQITGTSYSGTGCPQGTVSTILSDAKDLVTFGFDKFQATIGPSSPRGDNRKHCNLRLQLKFSDGWQMAIADTVYHGYHRLDDGINAKFTTDYDFQNNPNPGRKRKTHAEASLDGEKGGHSRRGKQFKTRHPHKTQEGAWSGCGKDAHMIVENDLVLSSRNKTATGEFAVDDQTVKFLQKMTLSWKKCK